MENFLVKAASFLKNLRTTIVKNWMALTGAVAVLMTLGAYLGFIGIIEDWPKMSVLIFGTLNALAALFGLDPIQVPPQENLKKKSK